MRITIDRPFDEYGDGDLIWYRITGLPPYPAIVRELKAPVLSAMPLPALMLKVWVPGAGERTWRIPYHQIDMTGRAVWEK